MWPCYIVCLKNNIIKYIFILLTLRVLNLLRADKVDDDVVTISTLVCPFIISYRKGQRHEHNPASSICRTWHTNSEHKNTKFWPSELYFDDPRDQEPFGPSMSGGFIHYIGEAARQRSRDMNWVHLVAKKNKNTTRHTHRPLINNLVCFNLPWEKD